MSQQAGRSEGEEILDEAAANDTARPRRTLNVGARWLVANREPQRALGQGTRRKMVVAAWAERVAELRLESGRSLGEWGRATWELASVKIGDS